ncbi:MAG: vWA domain-containing protein [Paracoccaceae bacterium]
MIIARSRSAVLLALSKFLCLNTAIVIFISQVGIPLANAQEAGGPLLVEGRKSIYQRVLTRPKARLHSGPEAAAIGTYPAFQPLYVFENRDGWVEVGPSISGSPEGWVKSGSVVPWKQNIVAAFTNAAGRKRQLIMDTDTGLRALMENEALVAIQADILSELNGGSVPADRGVVAAEPTEYVNITEQLYLMPILDFSQELHPLTYEENLLMKIASVPLRDEPEDTPQNEDFDAGIVFVFDTTQSMSPHIASTQTAVQKVVNELAGTDIGKNVQFGVVAFRDNPDSAAELEYRTKVLLPLKRRGQQDDVISTIRAATQVAGVNSPGFNEDSLAGVEDAIGKTIWLPEGDDPFDARVVVLITDAGPKDVNDPNARSQIGPAELQRDAQDKGIAIMTLHLQTPAGGQSQHAYAARQYRALSKFNGESYYYGIEDGSPQALEATVTRLVIALTDIIRSARDEETVLSPDEAGQELVNLGLAMRLAYLGRQEGTQAPDVIEGWVSEKAIEDPRSLAIEPRLLVTKNEMATMADYLSSLLTLGEQSRGADDAANFFSQVRDVVSRMAQNPDRLINPDSATLGGALEFLEDLPYKSQIMLTTQERWAQSAMNRRSILDGMRQKLAQYRKWLLDSAIWVPLYKDAPDGEYVFAMPFDVLP